MPTKPQYELASKVVKLKDLHNSLMALTLTSDTIAHIKHMYVRIKQVIDIGCSTSSLLPDIEHRTEVPNFFDELVPKPGHQFYFSILSSYKTISNALLTWFLRPETVTASASKTEKAIQSVESSSDGFIFLGTILHQLLPQFGGEPPNLLVEMATLLPICGEDYLDFHKRAIQLQTKLTLSRITIPPNMIVRHYLLQLNKCNDFKTILVPYNRDIAKHLRDKGDSTPFPESIGDIHDFLIESKCPSTLYFDHNETTANIVPTANYASTNRKICDVCDKSHDSDDCHIRGPAFMPPALAKKVERYNELHDNVPKVPKVDRLQKPYQARHQKVKPTANMVEQLPTIPDVTKDGTDTPPSDQNSTDLPPPPQIDHDQAETKPSCGMAEIPNVGTDYIEKIFPSVSTASIDLDKTIPASYIDMVTPSANMAETTVPLTSKNSTNAKIDEIFTHGILTEHRKITQKFQADWGANVIIVNNQDLFTDFISCQASLNPVDGIPINKIKGYGTVIFSFGNNIVPVREVAFMPGNPQCTLTTSHLQRMNGFLPGIHSMHSSVKVVSPAGIPTKFTPTKINGLDYIKVEVIVKRNDDTQITPTCNSAKIFTAELIHQKCGHLFHGRITELAKRKLVDGLTVSIPQLQHDCPICLATKSIRHPRQPMRDYTLLKPGQQMHMDFCFVPHTSIRGYTAILCIKCAHTRKAWCFSCPNKRAPIDIVTFFIRFLEKDGIYILEIRVDEDGALANSTEFCKLLHKNGIALQPTGGYSSDLNGNVEIFNKTLKRGTGTLLANAGLKEIFWCYASIHYCNLHNFLSYNHDKSKTAFEAWYGKRPQWNNFRIFGADIYILDKSASKNSMTKATKHTFLGWGTSTKTVHYLDSKTNEVKRARHVYFDDHSTATDEKDLTPGAKILRNTNPETPYFDEKIINLHNIPSPNPFQDNDLIEHKVDLTLAPHYPYGIIIGFDDYFGIPFAKYIEDTSPWYLLLPPKFRRNVWIVSINATEPITPTAAYEAIIHYSQQNKIITVTLSKWEPTTRTKLHCYRSQFDQVRSTPLHTVKPNSSKENDSINPTANYAVYAPTKPSNPNHIGEALSSELCIEWKKSLWEAYDKNARVGTFTAPFPAKEVPV